MRYRSGFGALPWKKTTHATIRPSLGFIWLIYMKNILIPWKTKTWGECGFWKKRKSRKLDLYHEIIIRKLIQSNTTKAPFDNEVEKLLEKTQFLGEARKTEQ